MELVVLTENQEKQIGRLAVGRAEMNFLNRLSDHKERSLEQVWLVEARMRQRQAARQRRGTQFLARLQAGQQFFRVGLARSFPPAPPDRAAGDALVFDGSAEPSAPDWSISGRMV